jgi:hypothetical protein
LEKVLKLGTRRGQIVEGGQGDKRLFRNRLFRQKLEGNRRGDKASPVSMERRSGKAVTEKAVGIEAVLLTSKSAE